MIYKTLHRELNIAEQPEPKLESELRCFKWQDVAIVAKDSLSKKSSTFQ